jgi:asparagine N-glycosylation enzyme membrane subunit Stt3
MVTTSLILFAIAAVLGLTVAIQILKNKQTNKVVAVIHGLFAATALIVLIVFALGGTGGGVTTEIVLFVIAALGGVFLITRDLMKKPGPKAVVVIHALVAVISFVMLLVFAMNL